MRHDEHSHDHDVDQETSRVPSLFLDDRLATGDRTGSSLSGNGSTTTTDALQCSYYTHLLTEQCTVYIYDCWRLAGGLGREGGGGARGWWDHMIRGEVWVPYSASARFLDWIFAR